YCCHFNVAATLMRSGSVSQPGHVRIDSISPGRGLVASFGVDPSVDRVLPCGAAAFCAFTEDCTVAGLFGVTGWIGTVATGSTGSKNSDLLPGPGKASWIKAAASR